MNILLADNSKLYLEVLRQAFSEDKSFEIFHASSIAEAVEMAARTKFDAAVLTRHLADGEGIELAGKLRSHPTFQTEPILLLTGAPTSELAEAASRAGITDTFRKQDIDELIAFLRRLLKFFSPIAGRVLYIEDSKVQRALLQTQLEAWGLHVDAYESADAAWESMDTGQYDLVICDIVLGGQISGARFINRIRRQTTPVSDVPIIAVTAFDNPARRVELFHLGIDDYVIKPIVPIELKARIQNLLVKREAEVALRNAKESAERISQAKTYFLNNLSHEMRTPLGQISGLAQLLRKEPLQPKQLGWLKKLQDSAENLTNLIVSLLDVTGIEAGAQALPEFTVIVEKLVNDVASEVRHRLEGKGNLSLFVESSTTFPALVGPADHIKKALLNYLDNAIRFNHSGAIRLRAFIVEEDDRSALIRFEVEDNGVGIRDEDQQRIFSIFEQVDNSPTRQFSGLGVGLALTKKIAQLMNGDAGCESQTGSGSLFWFSVRLKKPEMESDAKIA